MNGTLLDALFHVRAGVLLLMRRSQPLQAGYAVLAGSCSQLQFQITLPAGLLATAVDLAPIANSSGPATSAVVCHGRPERI